MLAKTLGRDGVGGRRIKVSLVKKIHGGRKGNRESGNELRKGSLESTPRRKEQGVKKNPGQKKRWTESSAQEVLERTVSKPSRKNLQDPRDIYCFSVV